MDNTGTRPIISVVATVAAAAAVITVMRTTAVVIIFISTVRGAATLPLMTVVITITITSTFRFGPLFELSKQFCVCRAQVMITKLTSVGG